MKHLVTGIFSTIKHFLLLINDLNLFLD